MLRSSSPQRRSTSPGNRWYRTGILFLTCLLLLVGQNSPLAMGVGSSPAYAAGPHSSPPNITPNRFNPKAGTQSKNQPYTPGPMGPEKPHAPQSISHAAPVSMQPGSVDLQVGKASTFLSSDGHLELSIAGNAITAADLAQAGGKLTLNITQIAPASGSNAGGSGHWTLGTYLLQLVDAHGVLVTHGLRQAVTAKYHFGKAEKGLDLFHAYTVLNGVRQRGQNLRGLAPMSQGVTPESTFGAPTTQAVKVDDKANTMQATPSLASASTTLTWQGDASVASFGKPDPFTVDLNAGGLTAAFPIDLPAGPGGLTPPVSLTYSSASTTEQHNPAAAAGWIGEGWNLGLGSVNWSEHNVWAGCPGGCAAFWENTWQFSDAYGTSSELIPPDINVSTFQDNTAYYYCGDTAATATNSHPCPILWHTANESHAKIYSYVGPVDIGAGFDPPCFRVWLPNGLMEEFGCTPDSVQFYEIANLGAVVSGWNLDLITDPQGNQIHLTYQQDMAQWTSPTTGKTYTYPRDAVLSTIEYDSPTCHNAQTMCTGANWAPLMRVNFASSHSVSRLTGAAPIGCNTGTNLRCDDPFDLSSSGGTSTPIQESTSVLNNIQVQVRSSGTASWNTLRDYQLSYEQSAPTTITDPTSGKQASVAGMLDLTQIREVGTDGTTALPARTFTYSTQTSYYEDDLHTPSPTTNCGPSWNTGNGSGCLLWSQSYPNNSRYLSSISNGMGLAQSFSWALARNNTHGVPGGGANNADPLYCNAHQSGYPCNEADDQNWSRVVLSQESKMTIRLTQNGVGGQQTSTPVTETSSYSYQLSYPLVAQECGDCVAGMYWGNQEDADYLGYYNAKFMGFAQATVSLPDGAKEVHKYFGTEGWGVYDTSQVKCDTPSPCHVDPWWHLANAAHGHEYDVASYDTDGQTLLKHEATTYQALCPPAGVSGTPPSSAYGNWNGNLTSTVDHNNPIAVCDIQITQSVSEIKDGSGNSVSTTTVPTYDSYGRVTQETITSNGGTPGQVIHKTAYVWNDAITATKTSASGTYIISTPAFSDVEDSTGNRSSCSYMSYDGQSYTTGQSGNLTGGLATTQDTYTNCGTSANGYTPSGQIRTTTTYDVYGNDIATDDADANAGIAGHQGCTVNSSQHTDCSAYDSTFASLRASSTNVLNQTASTSFSSTANGGFGLWPMSSKDFNGQTTTFTYDALGRMTGKILPGETSGGASQSWSDVSWCNGTAPQAPCIEIDQVDRLNDSTTVTNRAFYDGDGRLVETRNAGPNGQDVVAYAYYDAAGHMIFESNSYFVPAYTGPAGPAAFSPPDSTQVGTSGTYDGLERIKSVSDPNSQQTITSYSVQCGVPGYNDTGCYELATIIDANAHQRTTLTDGFEHVSYDQRYTGNSAGTYTLYATTVYTYGPNGNLTTIKHPANSATTTFTYDAAGRKIGLNDPDRGVESYSYDPNDNLIQSVDARGSSGTVYAGYDGLNRLLWHNTTNSPTGARVSYTYDSTANGNFGVGRITGESFTGSGGLTGSYSYTYDQRGQQTGMTTTVNGTNYPIQKTYDDAGNAISQTYPTGEVVQTNYTSQGWLAQVSTTNGGTTTTLASGISYAGSAGAANHITGMVLGNGVYTYAASYDATQRLASTSLTLTSNGLQLFKTQPSYDGVGNVTGVQTALPEGTDTQAFCYDEQNRLTWAGAAGTSPCSTLTPGTLSAAQYQQSFSYDTNGRLTTGSQGTYAYNDTQHLHGVTSTSSGYSAAYDTAGNMTCRSLTSTTTCSGTPTGQLLSYDAEGNLSTWQNQPTPTSGVNYLYDGEGNRVALQTTNGVSATTTTAYIGEIEEVTTGSTTTTTTFYYAGSQRIAEAVNGVFSYLGNDRLGSPTITLNGTGTVQATQLYAPYGSGRYSSGTVPTDIGFTGQHADSMTGLDYYTSRYYDPAVGQFTSADTALPSNGYNPWGLSRYAYVQGNPETLTDPDGHCWPLCTMIIGAVVGAVVGGGISIATQALSGKPINWGQVGKEAAVGAASGAIAGLAGPGAGLVAHAAIGAASGAIGQVVSNALDHKPLGDGVFTAAVVGGVVGFASEGASRLVSRYGGRFLGSVSRRTESFLCGESFSANTPVTTPTGKQALSTIKVGDKVQAYDPSTSKASTQTVQQVFVNHDNDLIDVTLTVDNASQAHTDVAGRTKQQEVAVASHGSHAPPATTRETVHTTQKHPWLTSKGWVTAGQLHVGDHIQRLDGTTATIVDLYIVPGERDMYDLAVSNVHTFAVGEQQFVVHNCNLAAVRAQRQAVEIYDNARAAAENLNPRAWFYKKVTVAVAHTDEGKTLIAMNEGALKRWGRFVRRQVDPDEWVGGFRGGRRHAERVLLDYAAVNNLRIVGMGVSRNPCPVCAGVLNRTLRSRYRAI